MSGSLKEKIVILGAGPTGLGAAYRLQQLGHENWSLFDQEAEAGGLASSVVDKQGFTWDLGGHVIFSHYAYFDNLLDSLLGKDGWLDHIRESWVWMRERFVPYPFQNNIWRLPPADLTACIDGLMDVHKEKLPAPKNFREWILNAFGQGIANVFMIPYNMKVWACDPAKMNTGWMGERVATVDVKRVLRNLVEQKDDVSWGPNATFKFPVQGGTGAIWKALANKLAKERMHFKKKVTSVDVVKKEIHFADGHVEKYDKIISTIPISEMCTMIKHGDAEADKYSKYAKDFVYSSSHIIGVGIEGPIPDNLNTKCWMYYPEDNTPFYRTTVFSNYSPNHVPNNKTQWSLMCEVSESPTKPVNYETIVQDTIQGCINTKMLLPNAKVVSTWNVRLEHGYPTPFVGRDELLAVVQPLLKAQGIWSRGRFGGWKYEVANQDHSMMQGVECVDNIIYGSDELTYDMPNVVNAKKSFART